MSLKASVGKGGINDFDDVQAVQSLFNGCPDVPTHLLHVDGLVGPDILKAIEEFQKFYFGWGGVDYRIDPGFQTEKTMNGVFASNPNAFRFTFAPSSIAGTRGFKAIVQ